MGIPFAGVGGQRILWSDEGTVGATAVFDSYGSWSELVVRCDRQ